MAQAIADIAEQRKALGIVSAVVVAGVNSERGTKAGGSDSASARAGGAGDSDAESDGEVAVMPRAETDAALADAASAPFDEDGPNWPSAADEAAFIGGEKEQGRTVPKASGAVTLRQEAEQAEAALGPLPGIDALIARIPAEAREMLEDLFRPKFTGVKRVRPEALK